MRGFSKAGLAECQYDALDLLWVLESLQRFRVGSQYDQAGYFTRVVASVANVDTGGQPRVAHNSRTRPAVVRA